MKPTATQINIARWGVVDDSALTVPNVVLTPDSATPRRVRDVAPAMAAADNLIEYLVHGNALAPSKALG